MLELTWKTPLAPGHHFPVASMFRTQLRSVPLWHRTAAGHCAIHIPDSRVELVTLPAPLSGFTNRLIHHVLLVLCNMY